MSYFIMNHVIINSKAGVGMDVNYDIIAKNIRKYRLKNRFTQEELAEMTDTTPAHISHIETNNTKVSMPLLLKIATALHVTVNDLIYEMTVEADLLAIHNILRSCNKKELEIAKEIIAPMIESLKKNMEK